MGRNDQAYWSVKSAWENSPEFRAEVHTTIRICPFFGSPGMSSIHLMRPTNGTHAPSTTLAPPLNTTSCTCAEAESTFYCAHACTAPLPRSLSADLSSICRLPPSLAQPSRALLRHVPCHSLILFLPICQPHLACFTALHTRACAHASADNRASSHYLDDISTQRGPRGVFWVPPHLWCKMIPTTY